MLWMGATRLNRSGSAGRAQKEALKALLNSESEIALQQISDVKTLHAVHKFRVKE